MIISVKKTKEKIFLCFCGNKFIKSRGDKQKKCLFCINKIYPQRNLATKKIVIYNLNK